LNYQENSNFSVIMPVHNEAEYLPYSLPSIYHLNPDEIIILLDKCKDDSRKIAEKLAKVYGYEGTLRLRNVNENSNGWLNRLAYLHRLGYLLANNDLILDVDADMKLDTQRIIKGIRLIKGDIKLVTFGFLDYPYTLQCFLRALYSFITPFKSGGNLHAFSKKAWRECESIENVKKIFTGQDAYLRKAISKKYGTKYIQTNTFHLRPTEGRQFDERRGMGYALTLKETSTLKMFALSFFMLRPYVFSSYLKMRRLISKKE